MYSSCIFCSNHLGSNETLETFPVGSTLAFDAWKGRLWAVCPSCGRWNLAPIEERWEAVETAEKRFEDTRLRIQSESIGVAQLPEGTRLVRVGDALPGELAAWRYGEELRGRRRRYWLDVAAGLAMDFAAPGAYGVRMLARKREVIYRAALTSATGKIVLIRDKHLRGARFRWDPGAELEVVLPRVFTMRGRLLARLRKQEAPRSVTLSGSAAYDLLSRAMVRVNAPGASQSQLRGALETIERFGSPDRLLDGIAGGSLTLTEKRLSMTKHFEGRGASRSHRVRPPEMLALEMALHEVTERRALEGELETLRTRWREAEEIASIADRLPGEPL